MFGKQRKSLPGLLGDLKDLTIDYAKQETLAPLKNLGRYLGAGIVGSFLLGIGLILWIVAVLRVLQEETGTALDGNLSWAPYMLTLIICTVIIALSVYAIGADKRRSAKRKAQREGEEAAREATGSVSQ